MGSRRRRLEGGSSRHQPQPPAAAFGLRPFEGPGRSLASRFHVLAAHGQANLTSLLVASARPPPHLSLPFCPPGAAPLLDAGTHPAGLAEVAVHGPRARTRGPCLG